MNSVFRALRYKGYCSLHKCCQKWLVGATVTLFQIDKLGVAIYCPQKLVVLSKFGICTLNEEICYCLKDLLNELF